MLLFKVEADMVDEELLTTIDVLFSAVAPKMSEARSEHTKVLFELGNPGGSKVFKYDR
jgi:hypothetical protein